MASTSDQDELEIYLTENKPIVPCGSDGEDLTLVALRLYRCKESLPFQTPQRSFESRT